MFVSSPQAAVISGATVSSVCDDDALRSLPVHNAAYRVQSELRFLVLNSGLSGTRGSRRVAVRWPFLADIGQGQPPLIARQRPNGMSR